MLYSRVPAIKWLRHYRREDIAPDTAAGLTLAIYNVPQGMAYSVLASLPPVYGLYASFFPPLLYFLFGTSRHISIGVFSITCLMVGQARVSILPDYANGTHATEYNGMTGLTPIDVVVVLAFVTGMVQVIMWILHLSFLSAYLSDSVVSGLTFGAALQALVAQLPNVIGVELGHAENDGFLHVLTKLKEILAAVPHANVVALALSMSTIAFLSMFKRFVDPCLQRRKISLPSELLALIITTTMSSVLHLHDRYNVKIVDQIPVGLPAPKLPRFELVPDLLSHATSIAVVSYVITVSMGKLFARKHKYQINNDQEMLALGLVGCFSSLFSVFPTTTSLSRSLINDGAGAKTQVSGLVSSCAILGVILFVAPVLEPLPTCVLSSIVIVALFSLLKKVEELPTLWRFSKTDVAVWVGTALVTFCWDIIEGLACGVVIALMTVIIRTQRPSISLLGKIAETEYRALDSYTRAIATDVPVIRFDAPVIFTNADLLKDSIRDMLKTEQGKLTFFSGASVSFGKKDNSSRVAPKWTAIILDCRSWTYTDAMGVDAVREINEEMLNKKVLLIFANLKSGIRIQYARAGLFKTLLTEENQFCPSIDDAIAVAALLRSDSCAFFHAETEDKIAVM
ncbi:sulfate permease [Ancylostoma caninum]|uniref:Sulfate permease n=1 Tax=Ancylostoma caninum TaxID=29170 RepID=A0A368FAJ0_ANCCA|nr:sulfate permease [Ancylostoma caninum]